MLKSGRVVKAFDTQSLSKGSTLGLRIDTTGLSENVITHTFTAATPTNIDAPNPTFTAATPTFTGATPTSNDDAPAFTVPGESIEMACLQAQSSEGGVGGDGELRNDQPGGSEGSINQSGNGGRSGDGKGSGEGVDQSGDSKVVERRSGKKMKARVQRYSTMRGRNHVEEYQVDFYDSSSDDS